MGGILVAPFLKWAGRLRHPTLFKLTAAAFLVSALLPDPIPFIDEIVLGLATLLFANWKNRKGPIDVPRR